MKENQIFKKHNQVKIFAVSGGPDSMYMLDQFRRTKPKMEIVVGHVNYNFRPDSAVDEKIVKNYCEEHNLKLEVKTIDKKVYENFKENFEEFARNIRYDFFYSLAEKYATNIVFVAHNLNDIVETYLLQKKRQNIVSYYGLKSLTKRDNLWIYRPLLNLKKSEIMKMIEKNQIIYSLDSSNEDQKYERNKIRTSLLETDFKKYLKEINSLNEQLKNEAVLVDSYLKINGQEASLTISKAFLNFSPELKKRIIIAFFEKNKYANLLLKRKKNTLQEVVKLVENQKKQFLKITIKNQVIVKDFNELYVVSTTFFEPFSLQLNDKNDLEKISNLKLRNEIKNLLDQAIEPWNYELTNDFENYKKWSFINGKKTNRYFIDKKIKYKNRFSVPALIKINDKEIINIKSFFKIWDNE